MADESFTVSTPVGNVAVRLKDGKVVQLDYASRKTISVNKLSTLARQVKKQIQQYFRSADIQFDMQIETGGTEFQQRVWRVLQTIPSGKTLTYGEVARRLQSSARAVGNACRNNPVPLIVPCHRVVASNGIGGFGGATQGANIVRKRWLLEHEGVQIN